MVPTGGRIAVIVTPALGGTTLHITGQGTDARTPHGTRLPQLRQQQGLPKPRWRARAPRGRRPQVRRQQQLRLPQLRQSQLRWP